jgi:hypothetical protein
MLAQEKIDQITSIHPNFYEDFKHKFESKFKEFKFDWLGFGVLTNKRPAIMVNIINSSIQIEFSFSQSEKILAACCINLRYHTKDFLSSSEKITNYSRQTFIEFIKDVYGVDARISHQDGRAYFKPFGSHPKGNKAVDVFFDAVNLDLEEPINPCPESSGAEQIGLLDALGRVLRRISTQQ